MNKKILIIEDDRSINKMVRIIMEVEDYIVYEAYDGVEGLRLMRKKKPDLVILDILMPGKNGFEVLKEKDIKIAMDLGAKTYLCKYLVKPELLLKIVKEFL